MKLIAAVSVLIVIMMSGTASAGIISDPENVTYAKIETTQSGYITLSALSTIATAEDMTLTIYIPQTDSRQKTEVTTVIGPDGHYTKEDGYGNEQLVLIWNSPVIGGRMEYIVESITEVETKPSGVVKNFKSTPLVEPSSDIIKTAHDINPRDPGMLPMLRIAAWLNENIEYDLSCEDAAFSAKWVFEQKRGTCDEYANLMVSMLKSLGYNAWYVAGYAFLGGKQEGGEEFGSHAWVETVIEGETYSVDPTWSESPADATHVTFARLPDSNFTEHTEVRSRDVSISWNKFETRLSMLEYETRPRVTLELEAIPSRSEGGEGMLIAAEASADGCVATNMRIVSCVDEELDSLIDFTDASRAVAFCDSASFYWVGDVKEVSRGIKYACPVTVAGGGSVEKVTVSLEPRDGDSTSMMVSTPKIALTGSEIDVGVTAFNLGFSETTFRIFCFLSDSVSESTAVVAGGSAESVSHKMTAPDNPGTYELVVFSDTGDVIRENIEVVSERNFALKRIEFPERMEIGSTATYTITVAKTGDQSSGVVILQVDEEKYEMEFDMDKDESAIMAFEYAGTEDGKKQVIVSVVGSDGEHEDAWTGNIEVYSEPTLKESVSSQLEGIITAILEFFRNLFG